MKVIVEDSAKKSILDIFSYNSKYSTKNAIAVIKNIQLYINDLINLPNIGRYIPEMSDKHFREIIYMQNRHSGYRIMYYISSNNNTIYVFNVMNSKQDFNKVLKLNNYFKRYFKF